ncbi:MAG: phosphotransferase [Parachlamydiales bacterium]
MSNFPDIQIPRLNYSEVSDNQILILIQKIDSKPMELNSIEIRWKSLCRVLEYFKFISNLATDNEVKKIHHKQTWKFILSLPLLMFVALIKHPRLLKELLYASSYLIKKSRYVLFSKNLGLVHRDLNSSNTLYKNGRITILDFQLLSLTVLSHDFGNFFYEMWKPDNSKQLDKLLLSKGVNKLSSEEEFMLIYSVLFDLSFGTEKSEQEAKQYIFHLQEIL